MVVCAFISADISHAYVHEPPVITVTICLTNNKRAHVIVCGHTYCLFRFVQMISQDTDTEQQEVCCISLNYTV